MDEFNRKWILANALEEIENYEKGVLTLRGLHYRLVSRGMTNTTTHYKRVIAAMTQARWEGAVDFDTFSDNDREMIGETEAAEVFLEDEISKTQNSIKYWMENYSRNKWENQDIYPEVFIEKKALQGVFESVCDAEQVALGACKGYPSLTFLYETSQRFLEPYMEGKKIVILYFGDYDPSGEDIPRSIGENLNKLRPSMDVEVRRISLVEDQVIEWNLPPAPVKPGDSRSASWDGLGQVELDAVEPRQLQQLCRDAVRECFDTSRHDQLLNIQEEEKQQYVKAVKEFVKTL